ncbi:replication factor A protein 3-like protein [uncultured Roseobacter sp.]|uniref:replication factor A protein 3-like protein n=1 Tax=uncultured Roseobacter sp. TaxID=114847 RepID=UPI002619E219|nr:replication factor A protein 3-like protein [uncultured Roseobacter sp.]
MSQDAPLIAPSALAENAGRFVRLAGTYRAEFDPVHKMPVLDADGRSVPAACVVLLALDDGTFVDLANRPAEEGHRLDGQRVIATGELSAPLSDGDELLDEAVAAEEPLYSLIHLATIEKADG